MLELLGREYVIECCLASFKDRQREASYKAYVTDALKAIAENGTRYVVPGVGLVEQGMAMSRRWLDLLEGKPEEKDVLEYVTEESCVEFATSMWDRIRGSKETTV